MKTPAPGHNRDGRGKHRPGRTASPVYATDRPAATLLDRLDAVRETGAGKWIARCPAHDDRTPSLSVRETADGTILVKCWAGCGAADIVQSIGLELRDLFPHDALTAPHRRRNPRAWTALDALRCLSSEATIAALAAADLSAGRTLSDDDTARLALAAGRLADAVEMMEDDR